MKNKLNLLLGLMFFISLLACSQNTDKNRNTEMDNRNTPLGFNELTPEEERVIIHKGTEMPFTGKYNKHSEKGTYICKRCNAPLYESTYKFASNCGWPSFDDEIEGAVKRVPDADGRRTEIICANCSGHLGHIFEGEGYTEKNIRHCVNSISMKFVPKEDEGKQAVSSQKTDTALFASGCFWGTEFYFEKAPGVVSVTSGYTGGNIKNPSYKEVSTGRTGHAETVQVIFDPSKTSYEEMAKLFFETHDPGQLNRQGPDIGTQYRSEIFYLNDEQKKTAEKLIGILKEKGHEVVTKLTKAGTFYPAEDYHQDYYAKSGGTPYCHKYEKKF